MRVVLADDPIVPIAVLILFAAARPRVANSEETDRGDAAQDQYRVW